MFTGSGIGHNGRRMPTRTPLLTSIPLLVALLPCCGEDGYLIAGGGVDAAVGVDAPADVVEAEAEAAAPCPEGLACEDPGSGMLACLDDGALPSDAIYGCDLGTCPPNFRCRFTDDTQTQTACYENCGRCNPPTTCVDVTGTGQLGCLDNGEIPAGSAYGCVPNAGCSGNFTCYVIGDAGTESVCVQNCSTVD